MAPPDGISSSEGVRRCIANFWPGPFRHRRGKRYRCGRQAAWAASGRDGAGQPEVASGAVRTAKMSALRFSPAQLQLGKFTFKRRRDLTCRSPDDQQYTPTLDGPTRRIAL